MLVDFELIQKAQRGDAPAFNQIVSVYRRRILGTISRLIGRPEDVEDVAQEVFVRLYFSLEHWHPRSIRTLAVSPDRERLLRLPA